MARGRGTGTGCGEGQGQGQGQGHGADTGENVVIGSSIAIACIVLFCVCGLPMLIAGAILIVIGATQAIGISLVAIAGIFTVVAIILIVLSCTGVIGKKNRTAPMTTTVTTVHTGQQYGGYHTQPMQPPAYSPATQPPSYNSQYGNQTQPQYGVQPQPQAYTGPPHGQSVNSQPHNAGHLASAPVVPSVPPGNVMYPDSSQTQQDPAYPPPPQTRY